MERTIWLDGRPHPGPNAPHTWAGFSTATWDVNMMNVYTTHLKENYMRRNGIPRSDQATYREHWVRHGNYLTVVTVITDPAFLTEPLVRSQSWVLGSRAAAGSRHLRIRPGSSEEVGRSRPASPAGHQSLSARSGQRIRAAVRRRSRRRRDAVPGIPLEDGQARRGCPRDASTTVRVSTTRHRATSSSRAAKRGRVTVVKREQLT